MAKIENKFSNKSINKLADSILENLSSARVLNVRIGLGYYDVKAIIMRSLFEWVNPSLYGYPKRDIKKNGGKTYEYYINLDERGEFSADVMDPNGKTVVEFGEGIFEDGFMRNKNDISGLEDYLKSMKIIKSSDRLVKAN